MTPYPIAVGDASTVPLFYLTRRIRSLDEKSFPIASRTRSIKGVLRLHSHSVPLRNIIACAKTEKSPYSFRLAHFSFERKDEEEGGGKFLSSHFCHYLTQIWATTMAKSVVGTKPKDLELGLDRRGKK